MTWRELHEQLKVLHDRTLAGVKGNIDAVIALYEPLPKGAEASMSKEQIQAILSEADLACEHFAQTAEWALMSPAATATCFQRVSMAMEFCEFVCFPGKKLIADEPTLPDALRPTILKWLLSEYGYMAGLPRRSYMLLLEDAP